MSRVFFRAPLEAVATFWRVRRRDGVTLGLTSHDRDLWFDEIVATQAKDCPPEVVDAEDPLFILYTSGSTGKPQGVLHTSGGYLVFAAMTHEHPFTHGMRYFADGPVLVKMSPSRDEADEVDLDDIQSKAAGAGAKAMQAICDLADQHNVTISLYAEGYAHVPTAKLVEYYKRFGFQERNEYMGEGQDMIRYPHR